MRRRKLVPVVFAYDLGDCPDCGEPWCDIHDQHYFACPCVGPHQDDEYDYVERDGKLFAKKKP